jgi:hypothetical protein
METPINKTTNKQVGLGTLTNRTTNRLGLVET